jgi:hypothetical protein
VTGRATISKEAWLAKSACMKCHISGISKHMK